MSSREEILASIRKHTQTRYEKPDIADMKRLTYPDKMEQFCAISRAVGGTAVVLGEGEDVNAVIRRTYPGCYAHRFRIAGYILRNFQSGYGERPAKNWTVLRSPLFGERSE